MCVCESWLKGCSLELSKNGILAFIQKNENSMSKLLGLELKLVYPEFIIINVYYECEYDEQVA